MRFARDRSAVTRLNRKSLMVATSLLAGSILGATLWSMRTPKPGVHDAPVELHNVDRVQRAEGLDQLPPDYSKMPMPPVSPALPTGVPALGAPLPGDLGGPILRAERTGAPVGVDSSAAPLRADAAQDAARAERMNRQRELGGCCEIRIVLQGGCFGKAGMVDRSVAIVTSEAASQAASSHVGSGPRRQSIFAIE